MGSFPTTHPYGMPIRITVLFLIILLATGKIQTQPVLITDFRIPTSSYMRLTGSLSGSWNKYTYDYNWPGYTDLSKSNATNFSGSLDFVHTAFSEDRSLEITASLYPGMSSSSHESSETDFYGSQTSNQSSKYTTVSFSPLVRYASYVQPDLWYWFVEGSGNGAYYYSHTNGNTVQNDTIFLSSSDFSKYRDYDVEAGAGVGIGKMRDGLSVFKAIRVLEKLGEDGVLARDLSRDEILRLVDRLSRINEYAYTQDRYVKFLMEDLFAELEKMGALKDVHTWAFEVSRVTEVLSEHIEPRPFGWRVSASAHHEAVETNSQSTGGSNYFKIVRDYARLQADYGYPVSLNTQLSAGVLANFPTNDPARKIEYSANAAGVYQIGERIDLRLVYSLNRVITPTGTDYRESFLRELSHRFDAEFIFFIENKVSFNIDCGYLFDRRDNFQPGGQSTLVKNSSYSASFGIRYRFI